jgi:AcrR family transcriptional regulator
MGRGSAAAKPVRRRSQAERSGETRARAIDAALACIREGGFRKTNMASIAARAGVTPGAIQHQFGDKAGILFAVIEHGLATLSARLAVASQHDGLLPERISLFVDAIWEGYGADLYPASLEVLTSMRGEADFRQRASEFIERIRRTVDRIWMGMFWDVEVPRQRHIRAQRLLFTTLNGLAVGTMLPTGVDVTSDLAELKRNLLAALGNELVVESADVAGK